MKVTTRLSKEINLCAEHKESLGERLEILERTKVTLLARHQRASEAQEKREKEQEEERLLREQFRQKSDEDFWEEYNRWRSGTLSLVEQQVLREERDRRKALKEQSAARDPWNLPAMAEEDSLETPEESSKQRIIIADWQAQRLMSRNKLRQLMQEKMNLEILDSDIALLTM
jgi:hypothetical protein